MISSISAGCAVLACTLPQDLDAGTKETPVDMLSPRRGVSIFSRPSSGHTRGYPFGMRSADKGRVAATEGCKADAVNRLLSRVNIRWPAGLIKRKIIKRACFDFCPSTFPIRGAGCCEKQANRPGGVVLFNMGFQWIVSRWSTSPMSALAMATGRPVVELNPAHNK